jgi:hypothetical protein
MLISAAASGPSETTSLQQRRIQPLGHQLAEALLKLLKARLFQR